MTAQQIRAVSLTVLMAMIVLASCSSDTGAPLSTTLHVDPAQRVVELETTGCGFASDRTGSGVAIGAGRVLTVAHLVAQADEIIAVVNGAPPVEAAVTAIDLRRDLAVLRIPPDSLPAVAMAPMAEVGGSGELLGGATSRNVPYRVTQVVRLSIEEVMGSDRHRRLGYELAAKTATGDSGAGAYDAEERLVGILFAISDEGETSWITASEEIEDFLAEHNEESVPIVCDPTLSRLSPP